MIAFLLFPAYLVGFSYRTIGVYLGIHYVVDVLTFCSGFYLVGLLILSVRNSLVRGVFIGVVCAFIIAFHWANLLFFYFFWDWLPFDAVWLIPDLRDVASGLPKLYGTADLIMGIFVPTLLAFWALRFRPERVRGAVLAMGCVLAPLLALGQGGASRFNDADPFMAFLRQAVAQFADAFFGTADYPELVARRDRAFPLATDGYRYADASKGLFAKVPAEAPALTAPEDRRPNVVLVLLESFRAYESGTYGATPSFTPSLDRLAEDSLVFENFYANGVQTVRGEFSLLTSQYDNLGGSPHYVLHPFVHLTTLASILKEYGYRTSQIQAYNGDFQNMRLFLSRHGVDRIYDWNDMPRGQALGWGLNDVSMFDRAIELIGAHQEPFFAEVLTLSSHFPFDTYPTDAEAPTAHGGETYVAYTRGIYYTDHALGHFLARARQEPWFESTIFIITADHGLFLFPDNQGLSQVQGQEAAFRVPLLVYAPGRVARGRRGVIGSQVDVAPTILELLGIRHANTFAGRSLLDDRIAPEDRFALLVQQSNWFVRFGNRYYYCGSPNSNDAPWLDFTGAYPETFRGERTAIGFETGKDLLRTNPRDAVILDPGEVRSRRRWAAEMIDVTTLAIRNNWALMRSGEHSGDSADGQAARAR